MRLRIGIVVVALLGLLSAGCADRADRPERPPRRYELKGKVVSLDKEKKQVIVAHQEIHGFMEAMTMPFDLKEDWPLGVLAPGQSITATLVVGGGKSWLEEIVVTDAPAQGSGGAGAGGPHDPAPGATAPDIVLTNQDGRKVRLTDFNGRFVAVTFIYTRCPLPDYCPRMGEYFQSILKTIEADAVLSEKVRLLSVSFDPEFDTPKVLRDYGMGWFGPRGAAGFQYWQFASGSQEDVRNLTQFFGLSYWRETNQIVHSLRTALIGPDGKLAVLYRGNDWKPEELVAEIRRRM